MPLVLGVKAGDVVRIGDVLVAYCARPAPHKGKVLVIEAPRDLRISRHYGVEQLCLAACPHPPQPTAPSPRGKSGRAESA